MLNKVAVTDPLAKIYLTFKKTSSITIVLLMYRRKYKTCSYCAGRQKKHASIISGLSDGTKLS